MAGWWSSKALDEQIARATSESLPSGTEDMFQSLEIADQIRSKSVTPKEAMRALKRRINHKNPNVQLAALKLTDTCVKNGGDHFLVEVASREFMDNLVSILKAPGGINFDVKSRILEEIYTWTLAFEGRPHLSYVRTTFNKLKSEGFQFPAATPVNSNFVDSSAPPEWADSDSCMRCHTPFTLTNRKHHCRNCGNVFCGDCSSKSMPLPHLGITQPVRVCETCYEERNLAKSSKTQPSNSITFSGLRSAPTKGMQPRNARVEDDDDNDLKLALQMSLEEAKRAGSIDIPRPQTENRLGNASTKAGNPEEVEDMALKAAIAASLKDLEENRTPDYPSMRESNPRPISPLPAPYPMSNNELSSIEAENITLFATLIERMQSSPPGSILRDPKIQELYEAVTALKPKLGRSLSSVVGTYETLVDMHAKLNTVVRYYDKMLEDRLATAYSHATYQEPRNSLPSQLGHQYNPPPQSPGSPYQQRHDYFQQPPSSHPENRHQITQSSYPTVASPYGGQSSAFPPQNILNNPDISNPSASISNLRTPSTSESGHYHLANGKNPTSQPKKYFQTSVPSQEMYSSYQEQPTYYQQQNSARKEESSLIDL